MVSAPSFSQHYLCIQATLQSSPENRLTTSVNFHLPILPYLFAKSSLQSPVTSPSPILQQFFTNLFLHTAYSHCNYLHQKYFPCLNHFTNASAIKSESRDQEARETCEYWHCFNLSLLPKIMEGDSRAHNH